jgi:p-aminobenzoyl-glutamate transporter AbgT
MKKKFTDILSIILSLLMVSFWLTAFSPFKKEPNSNVPQLPPLVYILISIFFLFLLVLNFLYFFKRKRNDYLAISCDDFNE